MPGLVSSAGNVVFFRFCSLFEFSFISFDGDNEQSGFYAGWMELQTFIFRQKLIMANFSYNTWFNGIFNN